ncbi:MAG TPA: hypothetical protein VHK63_06695 [Candidatus Limnocylindria bacterium]|nr:hypothetical protein [Candidatus Limnocylindria bacterium]
MIARWRKLVDTEGELALSTLTARYLGAEHRDSPGQGCTFAALGSELARADNTIRSAATRGLRGQIELLAALLPGQSEADRRKKALATYASLIGAMVVARAVDDPGLADEVLKAVSDLPLTL